MKNFKLNNDGTISVNTDYNSYLDSKQYHKKLLESGIPPYYFSIGFDDYVGDKESKEFIAIKKYSDNLKNSNFDFVHLYLVGGNSTQKSALACNILKQGIVDGMKVQFINAGILIKNLMKVQGYSRDDIIEKKLTDLENSDIICIDDAFDNDKTLMWRNSDNKHLIVSEWDNFLREIVSSYTKIIITSNYPINSIKQYYSPSLFELVNRNFQELSLNQSVSSLRKNMVNDAVFSKKRRKKVI